MLALLFLCMVFFFAIRLLRIKVHTDTYAHKKETRLADESKRPNERTNDGNRRIVFFSLSICFLMHFEAKNTFVETHIF